MAARMDWPHAHPYTLINLSRSRRTSPRLGRARRRPRLPTRRGPGAAAGELGAETTPTARTAADAYRRAVPSLGRHPPSEGAAYLGLEARCGRAPALVEPHHRRRTGRLLASPLGGLAAASPALSDHRLHRPGAGGGGG